MKVKVEEAL